MKQNLLLIVCCTLLAIGAVIVAITFFTNPTITEPVLTPIASTPLPNPAAVKPMQPPLTPTPVVLEPVLPVGTDRFVISLSNTTEEIAQNLFDGGYIPGKETFLQLVGTGELAPGGYKISKTMTSKQILSTLKGKPYMKWLVIPEGLRKEEIAEILRANLGWTAKQKAQWIRVDTAKDSDHSEGVFFPDTYLIPVAEVPSDTANRLIAKFNEKFTPYLSQFNEQNIKWTTGLTLASLVQREAASDTDMPLIAGILWNRLAKGMPLGIDATLQYVRGDIGHGYWAPITIADKKIDSPYNTYLNKGLPPHPIANPGIPAIEATLNPTETDCLYYLHDKNHITHCAATYEEHQANIEKYLKN